MKIILLDNYDSFTFNLYHYLSSFNNVKVDVKRNDKINSSQILKKKYDKIVISPGPGNPTQTGNCIQIVKSFYKKIPILGVCLGHQIIGHIFGSKVVQAKKIMHGKKFQNNSLSNIAGSFVVNGPVFPIVIITRWTRGDTAELARDYCWSVRDSLCSIRI